MSTLEALEKGLKLHLESPWCRENARKEIALDRYAYCAWGAIFYANATPGPCFSWCPTTSPGHEHYEGDPASYGALKVMDSVIAESNAETRSLVEFNDYHAKRKRDVTSIFKKAIKLEKAKVNQ